MDNERKTWYSEYVKRFKFRNPLDNFENLELVDVNTAIKDVDEIEAQRADMRRQNTEIVENFLKANDNRIVNRDIKHDLIERFNAFKGWSDELVDVETLEKCFVEYYEDLDFEYEVNKFCKENADKIQAKDFNKQAFIKELRQTDDYHTRSRTNSMWMLHFLMLHMTMNRNNRIQREAEEKRRAEERARQAAARRRAESYSTHNSTFGTGFGGGFSSGGGFKGGW